jgi:hypothetical protein
MRSNARQPPSKLRSQFRIDRFGGHAELSPLALFDSVSRKKTGFTHRLLLPARRHRAEDHSRLECPADPRTFFRRCHRYRTPVPGAISTSRRSTAARRKTNNFAEPPSADLDQAEKTANPHEANFAGAVSRLRLTLQNSKEKKMKLIRTTLLLAVIALGLAGAANAQMDCCPSADCCASCSGC